MCDSRKLGCCRKLGRDFSFEFVYLRSLHLLNFRNYADQAVAFAAPKTILVGENAQGKSNLLEAVELLATLKSHRASRDRDFVRRSLDDAEPPETPMTVARIAAVVDRLGATHELAIDLRVRGRRSLRLDGQGIRKRADFLGQVNAVVFSSLDLDLVRGGPAERRDWLDGMLFQLEPVYADIYDRYRQVLKQRNALLKSSDGIDTSLLAGWNAQLVATGTRTIRRRARLIQRLQPLAEKWHRAISGGRETLAIAYQPQVEIPHQQPSTQEVQAQFWAEIERLASAERARGSSLVGPHRDEVVLAIDGAPAKQYGSQGQQRTLVLALKLAELELIETVVGQPPLLLLDDVLAELDLHRQERLLEVISNRVQTLVTTTHLDSFDARWRDSAQVLTVRAGQLVD